MLTRQLRPGARIVSHAFSMGPAWPADKVDQFVSARGDEVTLYLWKADGNIRPWSDPRAGVPATSSRRT